MADPRLEKANEIFKKAVPVKQGSYWKPTGECPPRPTVQSEQCEGEIYDANLHIGDCCFHAKIRMDCCCTREFTRTFVLQFGPQTEPQVSANGVGTLNAYEMMGWKVVAHSFTDVGGGWLMFLTIGFDI